MIAHVLSSAAQLRVASTKSSQHPTQLRMLQSFV